MRRILWMMVPLLLAGCQCPDRVEETPAAAPVAATLPGADGYPGEKPEEAELCAHLASARLDLTGENEGLGQILEHIAASQHLNIQVNWPALTTAGVDKKTMISINLHGVPIAKALHTVLSEAGGAVNPLGYTVEDNVIQVSTKDDLQSDKYRVVCVYPIQDFLLIPSQDDDGPPPMELMPTPPAPMDAPTAFRKHKAGRLIKLIQTVVTPTSWLDNGGVIGSIAELNGFLIIFQTAENQRAVTALLKELRGGASRQISVSANFFAVDARTLHALELDTRPQLLTPALASALGKALANSSGVRTLATPRLMLFNGESAVLQAGPLIPQVARYQTEEVPAATQPVYHAPTQRYFPEVEHQPSGTTFNVAVAQCPDRAATIVSVRPAIARQQGMLMVAAPDIPLGSGLTVARPILDTVTFSATVVIPNDCTALVGGMPLSAAQDGKEPLFVFLLIRPTVVSIAK